MLELALNAFGQFGMIFLLIPLLRIEQQVLSACSNVCGHRIYVGAHAIRFYARRR